MKMFSVIVPLYNKAPYVLKALESINNQLYRDFELIVVNDGSTDGSAELAERYLKERAKDMSYQLIHQTNAGVSMARNNGVAKSTGEYITFLDADDWWEMDFLEKMATLISEYPEAGLYASNYIYYKPGNTHIALNVPTGYINYPKEYYWSKSMLITSITVCIPRNVWDKMGGFPLDVKIGEDFLLWSKIALRYKVAYTNQPLSYYNNDIPVYLRATGKTTPSPPQDNMIFHFSSLEEDIASLEDVDARMDWKQLLDKLRVGWGLLYWMNRKYHDVVAVELAKVDWRQQPRSVRRKYEMPPWLFFLILYIRSKCSCIKLALIRFCVK